MINEFIEYKEYMEVYHFYKKYRYDKDGYLIARKSDEEKNLRFFVYELAKDVKGYQRILTVIARYCLFHDLEIKDISDINEKVQRTLEVLDDWFENVIIAFYELRTFEDSKKEVLLEKAKQKRDRFIQTKYMTLQNDACSYRTIIAEAMEIGELREGKPIIFNKPMINYIKYVCKKDESKKKYQKCIITLIAFICYYKVYYKTDADEDGFVNVTLLDFAHWLGRKIDKDTSDIINDSLNIKEELFIKQENPYKFKIDLNLLEEHNFGEDNITFIDTGKNFANQIEDILKKY